MQQTAFSIPLRKTAMTVRTVERVDVPAGDEVACYMRHPGQANFIRATRRQLEQALLIGGIEIRADRVVSVEAVREVAAELEPSLT